MNDRNPVDAWHERRFWDRARTYSLAVLGVLVFALIAVLFIRDHRQDRDVDALASQYARARADKIDLCKQATNRDKPECATDSPPVSKVVPDASPTPTVVIQRLPTTVVKQALPASEVREAVTLACGGSCKGRDVTAAMIADAVARFCDAGACTGKAGADAPPPSDAQVQQAVASYCEANGCKGDPGPLCPDGYHSGIVTVVTSIVPPEQEDILVCRPD